MNDLTREPNQEDKLKEIRGRNTEVEDRVMK
jgi:hypothetical protein